MSISLCMIVKDEAERLPACLASVQGLTDDMVVLDTGSIDDTVAIARSHGARVIPYPWEQDFAAARNASLAAAKGDWILVLDADETLTPEARSLLRSIDRQESLPGPSAASLILVNLLRLEVGAQQAPYTLVSRFFRNRPDIRFQRAYHETVDDSIALIQGQEPTWQILTWPKVAIHHQGYSPDSIRQKAKFDRAQTLMERYLETHPQDPYILNKLGALYVQQQDPSPGIQRLLQGLALAQDDPMILYELHYHLGLAYRQQQQLEAATRHYQAALQQPILTPLKFSAQLNLGSLHIAQGQLGEAVQAFEQAIVMDPTNPIAHYNLGLAHRAQGFLQSAIAAYEQAIALQPDYAAAYQNLGVALFKLGRLPDCRQAFHRALDLYQANSPDRAQQLRQQLQQMGLLQESG